MKNNDKLENGKYIVSLENQVKALKQQVRELKANNKFKAGKIMQLSGRVIHLKRLFNKETAKLPINKEEQK